MDHNKVMEFLGQFVSDMGATGSAGQVAIGNRLGLYGSLAEGPATPEEFAQRTGYALRYLTEWLRGQAAGGYVSYEPATGRFSLTEEQAFCLADPNGPNVSAAVLTTLGYLRAEPQLAEAFRTGEGIAWHEHDHDVFVGCDAFYRPGYVAELVPHWIPGAGRRRRQADRRRSGGRRRLRARLVVGVDGRGVPAEHGRRLRLPRRVDRARRQEGRRGRGERSGQLRDRDGADVQRDRLRPGERCSTPCTTWAIRSARLGRSASRWRPAAPGCSSNRSPRDKVEDNFNPVGRLYYAGSMFLCVPNGLSQSGGYSLGAQAGEAATEAVITEAGFTHFRRAAQTPFNLVYEIRA